MRTLPAFVALLVLLVLGAATLCAEPEEESAPTLGLLEASEAAAEAAEALVKALAEKTPWQVRVDATFLRIDGEGADEILGEHRPDEVGSARPIPAPLARRLVGLARGAGAVRPEPLPPLFLFDGVAGRLAAGGRHSYVQDYDVEVGQDGFTAQPIVGWMKDGASLDVTARRAGKRLLVDVGAVWAEVVRPVERYETMLAKHAPAAIELPTLRLFHVKKQVELPSQGGFLLAGGGRAWNGETLRLVVLEVWAAKR